MPRGRQQALLLSSLASILLLLDHPSCCSAFTSRSVDVKRTLTLLQGAAVKVKDPIPITDATVEENNNNIFVTLPADWKSSTTSHSRWPNQAAAILDEHGVVALVSSDSDKGNNNNDSLINRKVCEEANRSAFSRVEEMHDRIERRGLDPKGDEEPYRFAEIVCRDDGGRRFDVPIPWLGENDNDGDNRVGAPLSATEEEAIEELHNAIGNIVPSVMDALWSSNSNNDNVVNHNDDDDGDGGTITQTQSQPQPSRQSSSYVAAAGFLMNEPGSQPQKWHRDGPDEGFIDCFVPLIDLNESLGPTAIQPGTHHDGDKNDDDDDYRKEVLIPLLNKGDILLFDYRTIHRGLGNVSECGTTRTLAYAVYKRKEESSNVQSGDVHNFPAALTLEYD